ncbi:MAG: CehA/McbA family metallohydrolase [Acidobacteriota bacterium]
MIAKLEEAIGGPHAIGRVGDYLLENDQVRFVIAGTGVCATDASGAKLDPSCVDVYGRVNTTFGGTLVDADLQRVGGDGKGNDQLAELLPGIAFSVIRPTKIEVTATGDDGRAAEVTVTGVTDDLFEEVYPINFGLVGAGGSLDFIQKYSLEPGKRYVTIETTIHNPSSGAHPLPYLAPQDLDALTGMAIPGLANLQLSVPLGQLPLMGGEQTLFAPGVAGFDVRFAIEHTYTMPGGFPAFPGMAVDFLATRGPGVSYGLAMDKSDANYVNAYKTLPSGMPGYPGQDLTPYSFLLPFTYAGVTAAYMFKPPDVLQANESATFRSFFFVGRGDVGSVYDAILDQRQVPTGTFGGKVVDAESSAPVASANVIILDAQHHILDQLATDAGGNFLGHLPPGTYTYLVLTDDRITTDPAMVTIAADAQAGAFVEMQPPATLAVSVLDEQGRRAPAKIQVLAHDARIDGIDGRNILYSLPLGEYARPTAFDGTDRYVEHAWWTTDGTLETTLRPGTYDLVVSRGPEYELTTKTIQVGPGQFDAEQLSLVRSFDTPGWIAGDFHIHAQPSTDSGLPIADRVASCAAEGLEVATATDHNYITDYSPVIANASLDQWLLGISGMELTTFEMGHFIGWPLKVDPGSTRGGEFVWAHQRPQQLFDQLRQLAIDPTDSIVQVAHPRQQVLGYFAQFFIDQDTAEPYTPTGILGVFAPYGDEFAASNFSYDFDALEVITGRRLEDIHAYKAPDPLPPGPFPDPQPVPGQVILGKDGRPQYPGTVETWFALLDRGHKATAMGASDSHHLLGDEPGYARTMLYVGDGNDVPGGYSRQQVVDAVKQHHAIATNAPFVTITIDQAMIGDTIVKSGSIPVAIHVHAPSWAAVDTLTVYGSTSTTPDHVIATMPIPAPGTSFDTTVTITPAQDAWVVAEVTGDSNMFPVLSPTEFPPLDATILIGALSVGLDLSSLPLTAALKPIRIHYSKPYAITNPIWIDVDGNGWQPPKPPLPRTLPPHAPAPDVRAQFEALP